MNRITIAKRTIYAPLVFEILLLIIITTITYLPNLTRATVYRDDWYYVLDRTLGGPQAFHEMFHIDRPARGYFFEFYYLLFGVEPAPYHLAAFFWRVLTALSALWLFRLLWPKQHEAAVLITILFIMYPGYTRWMEGMEDQPKIVSLFLQVTSITLTLLAVKASRALSRIVLWLGSIITGWGYLLLIDYAMGMEVFRFLCVFALLNRDSANGSLIKKGIRTIRTAFPAFFILGGFLFWRIFLFNNERPETDIRLQLETVIRNPLVNGTWWLIRLFQSFVNDGVLAWSGYSFQDLFKMQFPQILSGLLVAGLTVACTLLGLSWIRKRHTGMTAADIPGQPPARWTTEAIWIGLLGIIGGVTPVVMANRAVEFGILSHYGLPASLASSALVVGILYAISSKQARYIAVASILALAEITQYVASTKVAREEAIINNFWHQVAWRAPGIREATGLVVNYPSITIGEDVDSVHGPANFIYFPEPVNELPVRYTLFATKMYPWTVKEYLTGGKQLIRYRSHYGVIDYEHLLVISQPSVDSCVHIINQQWPWYAYNDSDIILSMGSGSNIRNVRPNADPPKLSKSIFGEEPPHTWCYYFEKAELSIQRNEWSTVTELGKEAASKNLEPNEPLEWMPFLQAYAYLGDENNFQAAAGKEEWSEYDQLQVFSVMENMEKQNASFEPQIHSLIDKHFYAGQN